MRFLAAVRAESIIAAVLLAVASVATAHEVLSSVEHGRAVAVKVFESDGDPLADADYELYSPAKPTLPHQKGKTDRAGYLAFVPDVAGKWHVRVAGEDGHGLDTEIDIASVARTGDHAATDTPAILSAAFVFRPLVGVAIIGAVFAGLVAFYGRKHRTR